MLQRHRSGQSLKWYKTLQSYYKRSEWELFDLKRDPDELVNVAAKQNYEVSEKKLGMWIQLKNSFSLRIRFII